MENIAAWLKQIFDLLKSQIKSVDNISDGSTRIAYQEFTYTLAAGARQEIFQVFNYFRVLTQTASTNLSIRLGQNGLETPFSGQGIGIQCEDIFSRLTLINTSGISMTITIAIAYGNINDDRLNVSSALAINGITLTSAPTSLGKAEDSAAVTGDIGVAMLGVRNDLLATTPASNDADYGFHSLDKKGAVFVRPSQRSFSNAQTTVTTAAVLLVTANEANGEVTIQAGSLDLYIGNTNAVTSANGFLIPAGGSFTFNGQMGDVYGIRASGSTTAYSLIGLS